MRVNVVPNAWPTSLTTSSIESAARRDTEKNAPARRDAESVFMEVWGVVDMKSTLQFARESSTERRLFGP